MKYFSVELNCTFLMIQQIFFSNYVLHNSFSILSMNSSFTLLNLSQRLTDTLDTYIVIKQLSEFLWLRRYTFDHFCILRRYQIITIFVLTWLSHSNKIDQTVVIKLARHFRIVNKSDVLRTFQFKTSHLRFLIDEIVESAHSPAIVLKYLENA